MSEAEVEALRAEIQNDKKALVAKQICLLQATAHVVQFDKPQLDSIMCYIAASSLDKAAAAEAILSGYQKIEGIDRNTVEIFAHKLARIGIHG